MLPISTSASPGLFPLSRAGRYRSALLASAACRMALAGIASAALWLLTAWALGWGQSLA